MDQVYRTVVMDGTTPVSCGILMAVNNANVIIAGSSQWNEGIIRIRTGGGLTQCHLPAEFGNSIQCILRVPRYTYCYIGSNRITADGQKPLELRGIVFPGDSDSAGNNTGGLLAAQAAVVLVGITGNVPDNSNHYRAANPGALIVVQAQSDQAGASIAVEFDYILHKYTGPEPTT